MAMTVKDELHALVDRLAETDAREALDYLRARIERASEPGQTSEGSEPLPPASSPHQRAPGGKQGCLSAIERDHLIRSVIWSQGLEGVDISYDEAQELLDAVLDEPFVDMP